MLEPFERASAQLCYYIQQNSLVVHDLKEKKETAKVAIFYSANF